MAFVAVTRVTSFDNLAFRDLPDYSEFVGLMTSPSFQARVRSDVAMRQAHVRTLRNLFKISPEEEEELHRQWDIKNGKQSTWSPPSMEDTRRNAELASGRATTSKRAGKLSRGDAVWCRGKPAIVLGPGPDDSNRGTATWHVLFVDQHAAQIWDGTIKRRRRDPIGDKRELLLLDALDSGDLPPAGASGLTANERQNS